MASTIEKPKTDSRQKSIEKMDFISLFNQTFRPYYHKPNEELLELRKWSEKVKVEGLPDNVWRPPKGFKRPSLYHPLYVDGASGGKAKSRNYSAKDDSLTVPVKDANPDHSNDIELKAGVKPIIKNGIMPVNTMLFSQNENTFELLCHVQAGAFRNYYREDGSKERKVGFNKSRIQMDKRDGDLAFCHLVPVGFCGSESDERTGVRWWSDDNTGTQKKFENKWDKATENFYWLARIEKIKNKRGRSGLSWDYYVYSTDGELLDSSIGDMTHLIEDVDGVGVWDKGSSNPWSWNFGIDEPEEDMSEFEAKAMKDYVYSTEWYGFDDSKLNATSFSTGKTADGDFVVFDSEKAEASHGLIAGTTGSGKSVWFNSVIDQLMVNATPQQVQFCMIDPNVVEFKKFDSLPYIFTPVIADLSQTRSTLDYGYYVVCRARANMFAKIGIENLANYNKWVKEHKEEAESLQFGFLPHVYFCIDEMASLMTEYGDEITDVAMHLNQEGRKFGVHFFTATQRPSVDVIPGTFKSNFPFRVGLAMSSATDASTLLENDPRGINPDKLKGNGDNIAFSTIGQRRIRSQGFYVSNEDSEHILNSIKFLHYGENPNYDETRPADEENNPLYDVSKFRTEDIQGELIRIGLYKYADDGSMERVV